MNTEEEEDLIHEVQDNYWVDFSKLVGSTLSKVPEHLRDDLLMRLQEKSSVYGSAYDKYIR